MLNTMRRGKQQRQAAERLYAQLVARARQPVFFARFAVPDTLDGRFDLLTLQAWLLLAQLKDDPALAQALVDRIFIGFDEALRELGVGDIGLGRRLKAMAAAFNGRLEAYGAATTEEEMAAALGRNLYRGAPPACIGALAAYVLASAVTVSPAGADFGPLPGQE